MRTVTFDVIEAGAVVSGFFPLFFGVLIVGRGSTTSKFRMSELALSLNKMGSW